jgi:competence protein ComEA
MERVGEALGRVLWSRYYMPVSLSLTLVLLLGTSLSLLVRSGTWQPAFLQPHPTIAITGPGLAATPQPLEAYVLGAVLRPGVYAMHGGARVRELVVAAGGLLDNADITRVDLAAQLVDGQSVYVPRLGEKLPLELGGKVDLNSATASELHNAPGITTSVAGHIVAYRVKHGRFTAVSQLLLVPVSKITYDRIKDLVTV